jgi:hypothetical protein
MPGMEPQTVGPGRLAACCAKTGRHLRMIAVLLCLLAGLGAIHRLTSEPRGLFGILADAMLLVIVAWGMWGCGSSLRAEAAAAGSDVVR